MTRGPLLLLETLDGGLIVAILSGLLFIEECGVPLPVAPGDLILLVGGIAIATGRVNPVVLVLCVSGALILGAITGRELFATIGPRPLWSIAGRLGATGLLDKAARRLRQGGWRGIFVCRLMPGLRVHTNQVAGALAIPRRTFLAGMVPATIVYISLFLGIGTVFGAAALTTVRSIDSLLVALLVSTALLTIALIGARRFQRRARCLSARTGGNA
jgi:membrane protein DedA with SNARE-associated domain